MSDQTDSDWLIPRHKSSRHRFKKRFPCKHHLIKNWSYHSSNGIPLFLFANWTPTGIWSMWWNFSKLYGAFAFSTVSGEKPMNGYNSAKTLKLRPMNPQSGKHLRYKHNKCILTLTMDSLQPWSMTMQLLQFRSVSRCSLIDGKACQSLLQRN